MVDKHLLTPGTMEMMGKYDLRTSLAVSDAEVPTSFKKLVTEMDQ